VLTAGTISTTPANSTDIVNKTYVDSLVASGIHFHEPVRVESPINLNATYNNGTSGVGATLTNAGTQVALVIDGVTMVVNDRVLIYQQTTQTQNGIYVVTDVGSGSTNWVLTRSADADTYVVASANGLSEGSTVFVQEGATGAGDTYTCNTSGVITFGTTNITFAQVATAQIYSAGTGLTLSGTQFSITNTGTAGTYGGANSVPVFTTNAQGQVTSVTPTSISISSAAVSGLAASATTDTTNANNITSGSLGTSRLSGSYTGITGVGALAAGSLATGFTAVSAPLGGTGQTSYAVGDILYADTTTSLARLADVAVGNALISGGVSADPSWGKIGLATHVDGTLPVANGGTGQTSLTANNVILGNGTSSVNFVAPGTNGNVLTSNGTTWTSGSAPGFPSGTALLFQQTAAPTGWTKQTTHDNKALRVVSGSASSGGSVAFTTAFASQAVSGTNANFTATNQAQTAGGSVSTSLSAGGSVNLSSGGSVGATTLITSQIPSHTHPQIKGIANGSTNGATFNQFSVSAGINTGATGGGGSHNHGFTNPTYSLTNPSYASSFTGTSHNHTQDAHTHTFTGTAINLAVQYVDVIIATKD
jgi:hypothetical protein